MDDVLLYADLSGIESHVDYIRRERHYCVMIYDHLRRAARYASPDMAREMRPLLQRIEAMERYFTGMADILGELPATLNHISRVAAEDLEQVNSQASRVDT